MLRQTPWWAPQHLYPTSCSLEAQILSQPAMQPVMLRSQPTPWRVEGGRKKGRAQGLLISFAFLVKETDTAASACSPPWTLGAATTISQTWRGGQEGGRDSSSDNSEQINQHSTASHQTSCYRRKGNPYLFKLLWAGFSVTWGQMHS